MRHPPRRICLFLALLMTVPQGGAGPAADASPRYRLLEEGEVALEACPGEVILQVDPAGPASVVHSFLEVATADRFQLLRIEGALGPLRIGKASLGEVPEGLAVYLLLKVPHAVEDIVVQCAPGTRAILSYVDAPVVDVAGFPARIVTPAHTRPGLRALAMDNFVDIIVSTPTIANVTVAVVSDGAPLPSTLQAFGGDPNATVAAAEAIAARVASDPPLDLPDILARLVLGCLLAKAGPPVGPTSLDGVVPCTASFAHQALGRYGLTTKPVAELAGILADDDRCPPTALLAALLAAQPTDPDGGPCFEAVGAWADATLQAELSVSPRNLTQAALTAAGIAGLRPGGPCGDVVQVGVPVESNLRWIANRTLVSRQRDCLELVVASLRPVRYAWAPSGIVTHMGSVVYGSAALPLTQPKAGPGTLTIATQGLAMLDITLAMDDPPATLGDALAPPVPLPVDAATVAGMGDAIVDPAAARLGLPGVGLSELITDAMTLHLDGRAAQDAADLAGQASATTLSPTARALLDRLPESCTVATQDARVACQPTLAKPLLPKPPEPGPWLHETLRDSLFAGAEVVWERPAADAPWGTTPHPYDPSHVLGAVAAFALPPGHALAPVTSPAAIPGRTSPRFLEWTAGRVEQTLFVPTSLAVRLDQPMPPPAAVPDPVQGLQAAAQAFAADRLEDLQRVLADEGMPTLHLDGRVPLELILEGTTFQVVSKEGTTTVQRNPWTSFRVVNLREGLERGDLDLDGVGDAMEANLLLSLPPPNSEDYLFTVVSALDPSAPDSDGDGMPDGWELFYCSHHAPLADNCREGLVPWWTDGSADSDTDLLSNADEFMLTLAHHADDACFASYRWICLVEAAQAQTASPCSGHPLLAPWSSTEASRDSDCDGFLDGWEARFGFDPTVPLDPSPSQDLDADGASNLDEHRFFQQATETLRSVHGHSLAAAVETASRPGPHGMLADPTRFDTDQDGLPDSYELARGRWPRAPDEADPDKRPPRLSPLWPDAGVDFDGDGYSTLEEYAWSLLRLTRESPGKGIAELSSQLTDWGLDPFRLDTDGDGLSDALEREAHEAWRGCLADPSPPSCTDPELRCFDPLLGGDCDGDGLSDSLELFVAQDPRYIGAPLPFPCVARLADASGLSWITLDSDDDGLPDGYECWYGLDPTAEADAGLDQDEDGLTAREEWRQMVLLQGRVILDPAAYQPQPSGIPGAAALLPAPLEGHGNVATDRDQDSLPDAYEIALGLDPFQPSQDHDTDRDGLTNLVEARYPAAHNPGGGSSLDALRSDVRAGIQDEELLRAAQAYRPSPARWDSDGDGMADGWEDAFGLRPFDASDASQDPDGDNLSNLEEYRASAARFAKEIASLGTVHLLTGTPSLDPTLHDSDHDGMPDGFEQAYREAQGCSPHGTWESGAAVWAHCFDPIDQRGLDAAADFDADGLTNRQEAEGWLVRIVERKLEDGVTPPKLQVRHVTANPLAWDTSGGGLSDADKAPRLIPGCPGKTTALDPWSIDTDSDGLSDRVEVWEWTAVQGIPEDIDGDCFVNAADVDSDGDSFGFGDEIVVDLSDGRELELKMSEAVQGDTDGDGLTDGRELYLWLHAGYDPAASGTDFDGDGKRPLRDPDADDDMIPDGFEFTVGTEPWAHRDVTWDSDGDTLPDVCEYRVSVGGDMTVCPGSTGPEPSSGDEPPGPGDGGGSALLDPTAPDSDADGLPDDFELAHAESPKINPYATLRLGGCNPKLWTYHADHHGNLDPCAEAYAAGLASLGRSDTALRQNLIRSSTGPAVLGAALGYDFHFDSDQALCLWHRHCVLKASPSRDTRFHANIVIQDDQCDLAGVRVYVDRQFVVNWNGKHHLEPKGSTQPIEYPLPTGPDGQASATWSPSQDDAADCRRDPGSHRYTLRIVLSWNQVSGAPGTWDKALRLTVIAWDALGATGNNVASDLVLPEASPLNGLNQALRSSLADQLQGAGLSLLGATRETYIRLLAEGASSDPSLALAASRLAVDAGMSTYLGTMAKFGTPAAATSSQAKSLVQQALGGRAKAVAGLVSASALMEPVALGFARGTSLLLHGGMGQRAISGHVIGHFGPIFGADPTQYSTERMEFWDWFVPASYASSGKSCDASYQMVNAARALAGAGHPSGLDVSFEALRQFHRHARQHTGPITEWDLGCVEQGLRANANIDGSPDLALGSFIATGWAAYGAYSTAQDYMAVPEHYEKIHAADPDLRRVARFSMARITVELAIGGVREMQQQYHSAPRLLLASTAGCLFLSGTALYLGAATTPASFGTTAVVGLLLSGATVLECIADYYEITKIQPPEPAGPQGSRHGRAHRWTYEVTTFPDTKSRPGDLAPAHTQVRLRDLEFTEEACNGFLYRVRDATIEIKVDRAAGRSWQEETTLVIFQQGPGAGPRILGQPQQTGLGAWGVTGSNEDLLMRYYAAHDPGLRRVTIRVVPGFDATNLATERESFTIGLDFSTKVIKRLQSSGGTKPLDFPVDIASVASYHLPQPPKPWTANREDKARCYLRPLQTEATVVRGLGADLTGPLYPGVTAVINDITGQPDGLNRTFNAEGSTPNYLYYWDFGDIGTQARSIVRKSPGDAVSFKFQPGPQSVVLSVVDPGNQTLAAQSRYEFEATRTAFTRTSLEATREGNEVSFTGYVRNLDDCVSYTLDVAQAKLLSGRTKGILCGGTQRIEAKVLGTPEAKTARLVLAGGPNPGTAASLLFTGQRAPATLASQARGHFIAPFMEVDILKLRIPDDPRIRSLTLQASGQLGHYFQFIKDDGTLHHHLPLTSGWAQLTLPNHPGRPLAGDWTVLVHSNGNKGAYVLTTNLERAIPPPEPQEGGPLQPGPQESGSYAGTWDPPTPAADVLLSASFDSGRLDPDRPPAASATTKDLHGAGAWSVTSLTGRSSAYAGIPGLWQYDAFELDTLHFVLPLSRERFDADLALHFMSWSGLEDAPLNHGKVTVSCGGAGPQGIYAGADVATQAHRGNHGWRAAEPLHFNCRSVPVVALHAVMVTFAFSSGDRHHGVGWMVDDVLLRTDM